MAPSTPKGDDSVAEVIDQSSDDETPSGPLASVVAPSRPEPVTDAADKRVHENDLARIQRALAAQPKVTVKVQEDTYVGINGYPFLIKGKTKVSVPQQVADILEEAGRI